MFKPVKTEQPTTVYCDGSHHVTVTVPANAYAHEAYGIELGGCDCVVTHNDIPVLEEEVTHPQTPEEFDDLGSRPRQG